jgi:hypothetical protein
LEYFPKTTCFFRKFFSKPDKVWKAANKLDLFKKNSYMLSGTFLWLRNWFPKQFYNNHSGVTKEWKAA